MTFTVSDETERPIRWVEVKAMTGSLADRPVGLSRTQFDCAREHGVAYWLYVVKHATETDRTRILRIQDPVAHPHGPHPRPRMGRDRQNGSAGLIHRDCYSQLRNGKLGRIRYFSQSPRISIDGCLERLFRKIAPENSNSRMVLARVMSVRRKFAHAWPPTGRHHSNDD